MLSKSYMLIISDRLRSPSGEVTLISNSATSGPGRVRFVPSLTKGLIQFRIQGLGLKLIYKRSYRVHSLLLLLLFLTKF